MKTVIFIGSRQFGEKNDAGLLARQVAEQLGGEGEVAVRHYVFEDLLYKISNSSRSVTYSPDGADLKDADLVIAVNWYTANKGGLRDLAYTLSLYLQENDVPFWNGEMGLQRSTTKLSATWQLASLGVAIPDTVFSLNREAAQTAWASDKAVVKDIAASRGRDNHLAHGRVGLAAVLQANPSARYMVQEFIPNDFDVRVVCFDGRPQLVIKRQRTSDATHLNNTSQGAEATLLELTSLPESVQTEVPKICQAFGRQMAGVDYLVANDGTSRYICLEVNAVPQLTSGSFTEEKCRRLGEAIKEFI